MVEEYTADELAADSDDEKRLEKAERKAAKRRKVATDSRVKPYRKPSHQFVQASQVAVSQTTAQQLVLPRRQPPVTPSQTLNPRPVGPCFACGQMGHLRSYCPKTSSSANKAWYPPLHDMIDVNFVGGCVDEMSLGCVSDCDYVLCCSEFEIDTDLLEGSLEFDCSGYSISGQKRPTAVCI